MTNDTHVLAFGTGQFLRAFIGDFADRAGVPITMISSTPSGDERAAALSRRGSFTLAYRGIDADGAVTDTWRPVRSIRRALSANGEWAEALTTARDPAVGLIVSNVTESALKLSDDPEADRPELAPPASFPAKLARWLWERFTHFGGEPGAGVVMLPCELVEGNGGALGEMVRELARRWELPAEFAAWLGDSCIFADTLVDRIVPGTPPPEERETLWRERLGGEDDPLLTVAEPFALWAIRGDDALARRIGWLVEAGAGSVAVAEDITPFTLRKVRILNGLHTAMASIGPSRYGIATVREAVEHPELGPFLHSLVFDEILPAICPPLEAGDARAYAEATWRRMANPFLAHRLSDIDKGAPAKWENRLLPTLRAYEERFDKAPARLQACREAFLETM